MQIADVVVELDTVPHIVNIIDDFYFITTLINNKPKIGHCWSEHVTLES